jgi:hypothetical protein
MIIERLRLWRYSGCSSDFGSRHRHCEGLASENAMRSVRIGIVGFMGRTYAECLTKYNQGATLIAITGGSRAATLVFEYGEIQI